jgi:hypothetical protein
MENMTIMVRPEIEEMMDIAFIEDAEPDYMDVNHFIVGAGFAHPVQPGVAHRAMVNQAGDIGRVVPLTFVQVASPPPASPAIPLQDRNLLVIPSSPPVARRRRMFSIKRSQTKKIMDNIKRFVSTINRRLKT